MRQLQPRIDGAAEQLQGSLDAALAATLRSQSPLALGVCLHAYSAIARPQVGCAAGDLLSWLSDWQPVGAGCVPACLCRQVGGVGYQACAVQSACCLGCFGLRVKCHIYYSRCSNSLLPDGFSLEHALHSVLHPNPYCSAGSGGSGAAGAGGARGAAGGGGAEGQVAAGWPCGR